MAKIMFPIWVAMYSQTGSELAQLIKETGKHPNVILTNTKSDILPELVNPAYTMIKQCKHDELMGWLGKAYPEDWVREKVTITLHGYLRIIPPDICERYKIYNGHPGAIDVYPELKGKDPQERTWENRDKYKTVGSVVHRVIPAVDEGEIVSSVHYVNRIDSKDELYLKLKESSLTAWKFAMGKIL